MIPDKIFRTTTYLNNDKGKVVWKETPVNGAENIAYIRKDIHDDIVKTAEDHAFLAGAEWMARQMKQEQPEKDLEKEIDKEWAKCEPMDEGMGLESANIVNEQFDFIARHFYELGGRLCSQ